MTALPDIRRTLLWTLPMTPTSSDTLWTASVHIGRKSTTLQSGAQRTIYYLMLAKTSKDTPSLPVYISGAEVKHFFSVCGNHYHRELVNKAKFPCQVRVNLYSRQIESILTGNITNWHGSCTGSFCSRYGQEDHRMLKDNTHPSHSLFTLLLSGNSHRSIHQTTKELYSLGCETPQFILQKQFHFDHFIIY